jgi:hypothetical protein
MADLQISNLPALAEAGIQATDVLALADLSATETKKVTVKDLVAAAAQFLDAGDIPAAKVGSGISAGSLADGSVTNVKLANDSVSFGGVSVDLGAADATPAFNLSDATAYPTSALVGTITNAQLAGSIANAKLANSSVSLGGITVALGASDATPAFDLTDATSYKTTNLVGTITNAQLAGSIDVSKLVGSNVNFGGVTVALGASDTTPAFNLSDATNYPTSALVGTITNAQLAGSIANTKLVANSITANELAANSVTDSELANLSVATGSVQDGAITNDKVQTSTNSSTGLDGATKIRDATITPAKLNTSNLDRSLNVASGNLGINNVITAGTRSGITFNAQGLILSTAALGASDLPIATSSAVGGVSVGTGLSVNGSGVLSLSNSVTGATVSGITFSNTGQITAATALVASDLPVSTTSAKGAVQITSGGGLTVDGSGNLTTSTSGISAGTYQSITVNNKGVATAGAALTAALIPSLAASKITSGSFDAARIANDSIDGTKLSNASTAVFQSIAQSGYPTAQFSGQILFDTVSEDAFIWDGNAWQAITTLTKGSLVFGGTYNANTSQMVATTSAGIAAGLSVGSNLPTPSATTDGVYVVVATSGTPSSPAPAIAFAPPDYILGVTNSAGSSWNEVDLSQTVAGQVASNITFTPYGQISSTNVQDAMQELETEKLALTGGTVTGQVLIGNTGSLVFEGSSIDAFETTIGVTNPTSSDKTILFPDISGNVITSGDTNTVTSTMVDASLVNTNLAAGAAIAFSKLAALTSAQILVGNGSNVATAVAVTGDISINNAGLTAIASGVIVDGDISGSAAITGSKIATGTTSAVGVLQLTDSAASTSATTAATPAAVKIAKDAADAAAVTANAALPTTGGTLTGNLILDNAKELRLSEADGDGANYTGLKAQAQSGDITLTLPAVAPTAGQVLKANASTPTTLEWGSDSATDATKMPLVGGTFTGDVTFTGDASNGLWDKSASAFVADLTGDVTGTASIATSVTVADESSDTTCFPLFATAATGNLGAKSGSNLTFNSNTGALTATSFVGALTGNVTGNASGSAATVTAAAQSAITSLGTLTSLGISGNLTVDTNTLHVDATNNAVGIGTTTPLTPDGSNADNPNNGIALSVYGDSPAINLVHNTAGGSAAADDYAAINFGRTGSSTNPYRSIIAYKQDTDTLHIHSQNAVRFDIGGSINSDEAMRIDSSGKSFLHGGGATGANDTSTLLSNGNTLNIHGTSSVDGVSVVRFSANYGCYGINIAKSNSDTFGTNTLVTQGEELGHVSFYGADGSNFELAAQITGLVDINGAPTNGTDMPGALSFRTSPDGSATPSERLKIDCRGFLGINESNPDRLLHISANNNGVTAITSANNTLRFTDIDTTVTSGQPGGVIEWETLDSTAAGVNAYIATKNSNTGYASMHFGTGNTSTLEDRLVLGQGGDLTLYGTEGTSANLYLIADQGDDNGDGWRVGSNQDANDLTFANNTSGSYVDKLTLLNSGNATFAGTVSDSKGNLRSIPANINSSAYTLVAADAGKCVTNTSGGWTVNNSVFSAGDAVTLINNGSGSDQTITQGSGSNYI